MFSQNLAIKFAKKMEQIVKNQANKLPITPNNHDPSVPFNQQNLTKWSTRKNQLQNTYLLDNSDSSHHSEEEQNDCEDEIQQQKQYQEEQEELEEQDYLPKKKGKGEKKINQKKSTKKGSKKKNNEGPENKKGSSSKHTRLLDSIDPNNIKSSKRISKPIHSSEQPKIIHSKKYELIQEDKEQLQYSPIDLQVKIPKIKFSTKNSFVEQKPQKKSAPNRKKAASKRKDPIKEQSSNELPEENNFESSLGKQKSSYRKKSQATSYQERQKEKINGNEALVKELENAGLNQIQKKEVVHIIERFMFENIGFIAKNIGTLLQSQILQNSNYHASPEEAKQFSLPRKRAKVIQQTALEDEIQRIYKPIQNFSQKSLSVSENNGRREATKETSRTGRKNFRNALIEKQEILNMIQKRVESLQRKNHQQVSQQSFKKLIVQEALQIVHSMKIGRQFEEQIIGEWIDRRKKREYEKKILEGRLNGLKQHKIRN